MRDMLEVPRFANSSHITEVTERIRHIIQSAARLSKLSRFPTPVAKAHYIAKSFQDMSNRSSRFNKVKTFETIKI